MGIAIAVSAGSALIFLLWRRRQDWEQLQALQRLQDAHSAASSLAAAEAPAPVREPESAEPPPPELEPELKIILSVRLKPEDPLKPIITRNAGRSLACNHAVAAGEILLQKRMEAKAPGGRALWRCSVRASRP